MSISNAYSTGSLPPMDLPNLPGIKRNVGAINPKLYREFKSSQPNTPALTPLNDSFPLSPSFDENSFDIDNNMTLDTYFESAQKLQEYSKILNSFPRQGTAYNDVNGRYSLVSQKQDRINKSRSLPYTTQNSLPAFVTNTSKVFTFLGLFSEKLQNSEGYDTRKVEIRVFLEDNSIEIREPKVENSGTWQGKFLKRHQIVKPSNQNDQGGPRLYYTLEDFYAGAQLDIYNRVYTILDCDRAAKDYFYDLGLSFGEPLELPASVYDPSKRSSMSRSSSKSRVKSVPGTASSNESVSTGTGTAKSKKSSKAGFFEYDRKVLRFYGVWDCRAILFGDEIKVRLHYSLADDCLELVPVNERNSGRPFMAKFLKRSKILKPLPQSGLEDSFGDLRIETGSLASSKGGGSAFRGSTRGTNRPSTSASTYSAEPSIISGEEYIPLTTPYHWTDLKIGQTVQIGAMSVMLVDADEFTREFYNSKNMPLTPPIELPKPVYPVLQTTIPPYNGFGSEEDSLQTCKASLIPSVPMKDGMKAKMYQGMILRYNAKLANPKEADRSRSFIIQVHLEDDTIQIREPPIRNSGHKGGIFLARCKIESHGSDEPKLELKDIFIGGTVTILAHKFIVNDADAYSLKYMENSPSIYEYSNIKLINEKLKEYKEVLQRVILTHPGLGSTIVNVDELMNILAKIGLDLVKQEGVTLLRSIDVYHTGSIRLTKLLKHIMDL
eukprot:gene5136-7153_t